jgi:hypothetical protein
VTHRKNEAAKNPTAKSKLTSFFKKKLPGSSSRSSPLTAAPSLLQDPTPSFSGSSQDGPSSAPPVVNTPDDEHMVINSDGSPLPPPPGAGAVSSSSLLSELEHVSVSLPLSIPEGTEMDVLARFSGNPVLELEASQDVWEMAD